MKIVIIIRQLTKRISAIFGNIQDSKTLLRQTSKVALVSKPIIICLPADAQVTVSRVQCP